MPEFTTVTWDCHSCGWHSEPDGFIGTGGEGPASDWLIPASAEASDDAVEALTDRERAVVKLVAAGMPNQEIADYLVVSINTVKTTIRTAYHKMNVETRTQAILWAIRHGLVDPPE